LALLAAVAAQAQLSPGPLSKAHKSLAGPAHCTACHALTTGAGKFKCLSCHSDIRQRISEQRGLHATLAKENGGRLECIRCHSEHNGEKFVPILWDVDLSDFDHAKTGYNLEGSHRGLECRRCHTPKNVSDAARRKIVVKDMTRTYLGLTRDCQNCHPDQHRAQLSSDCLQCHNPSKWKPASGFDHAKAKFQLSAAHLKVACEKCHAKTADPHPVVRFARLQFSTCDACHKDPHRAAFSTPCQSCHSDDAWKPTRVASQFDHSKTEFPLAGKHSALACNKCHHSSNFKDPVAHIRCLDCHTTPAHAGQFTARSNGGECSACHVVDGWKRATFGIEAHRTTRYPLDGRHAAVACAKCHKQAGQDTLYRVRFGACTDCHRDQHNDQFAGPPNQNRCDSCHTVNGFRPAIFSQARHAETRMPLGGAHLAVPCQKCHSNQGADATAGHFRFQDTSCGSCHEDTHQGQFQDRMLAARADGSAAGCGACHSLRSWSDVPKFDHSDTTFRLTGTHRGVTCEQCHRPADPKFRVKGVVFRSAPAQCSGCHKDSHAGQFASRSGATDCGRCHASLHWKPAVFDHNKDTSFRLAGAHQEVKCVLCHKASNRINGKLVVIFKPAPRECDGCHGPKTAD
jgi:hypothetical protein